MSIKTDAQTQVYVTCNLVFYFELVVHNLLTATAFGFPTANLACDLLAFLS